MFHAFNELSRFLRIDDEIFTCHLDIQSSPMEKMLEELTLLELVTSIVLCISISAVEIIPPNSQQCRKNIYGATQTNDEKEPTKENVIEKE